MCGIFMDKNKWKQKLTDATGMPKDVVYGIPILTIQGHFELTIENYRGILEYTDTLIRIQTKTGQIHVRGVHLEIPNYNEQDTKIIGHLEAIEFYGGE